MNKYVGYIGPVKNCLQATNTKQCRDDFKHYCIERFRWKWRFAMVHALTFNQCELVSRDRAGIVPLILTARGCTITLVLCNPFLQAVTNRESKVGNQLAVHQRAVLANASIGR